VPTDETRNAVDGPVQIILSISKKSGLIDAAGTALPSQRTTAPLDAAAHASRSDSRRSHEKFAAPAERVSRQKL
jgi:hypothetical protein